MKHGSWLTTLALHVDSCGRSTPPEVHYASLFRLKLEAQIARRGHDYIIVVPRIRTSRYCRCSADFKGFRKLLANELGIDQMITGQ